MQRIWWYVIGAAVTLSVLLTVLGFAFFNRGSSGDSTDVLSEGCTPEQASPAAGNSSVDGRAVGKGYQRKLVLRVTDKQSGVPLHGADVRVQAIMDCPHYMPLYRKKLREASTGTYKADYQLVMQGHWIFHVVVRSKQNGSTTASFPLTLKIPG